MFCVLMSLSVANEVLYYRLIDVYIKSEYTLDFMKTGQSHVGDLLKDANEHSMTNLVDENMFLRKLISLRYFYTLDINY